MITTILLHRRNVIFCKVIPDKGLHCEIYNERWQYSHNWCRILEERGNMSKVNYTDAPPEVDRAMDNATPVDDDFLPSR